MSARSPEWIAGQRWFRAKQRPIARVSEIDRAPLDAADLVVLEVAYADGGDADRYLDVLVDRREPEDGDGAWAALVDAMRRRASLPGVAGTFACDATDAFPQLDGADLAERRLRVEQSNTSVALGERMILKLFRRLEPGLNPDLEIGAFLTDAGFADTPRLLGSVTYDPDDGDPCAVAMLQELVPTRGDAWSEMLGTLATDAGAALEMARRIGAVTARMHDALASAPGHRAFPSRVATPAETAAWRASAERQLAEAVAAVSGENHERLVALAPSVRARFADTFGAATDEARISRIHGDYHLGQLLARTEGGFSVIDFEGEPARPLAERRLPSSPLRDVAGMLRSLDYAARTAERASGLDADHWLEAARAAFLDGYGGVDAAARSLLAAFELEKACYEVRYEAGNRPDWLWLPLSAIGRLVGGPHR